MSKQSDSVKAVREAKLKAERRERQAATFREFWYACQSEVPPGVYYETGEEAREGWRKKAENAAAVLGLSQP